METQITKWGNSLGIRIPANLAKELGVKEGNTLDLKIENNALVIRPAKPTLDEMLATITPDQLHGEVGFGRPVGR
jgi:antitoxin MazE